jgi:hypothetical protein
MDMSDTWYIVALSLGLAGGIVQLLNLRRMYGQRSQGKPVTLLPKRAERYEWWWRGDCYSGTMAEYEKFKEFAHAEFDKSWDLWCEAIETGGDKREMWR